MKSVLLVIVFLVIGLLIYFITVQSTTDTTQVQRDTVSITNNNAAPKTDNEVIAEATLAGIDKVQEIADTKRRNDSIKKANRQQIWVYQIGLPKNSEEELWNVYERVKGMGNVSAFKLSRNTYILIKNDSYSQQEVTDSIGHFNMLLRNIGVNDVAKPYDLVSECKLKEKIIQDDNIKVKKGREIPCFVCD